MKWFALVPVFSLLFVSSLLAEKLVTTTPVPREGWWVKRHEEKLAQKEKMDQVDLVMIGDSITHAFEGAGKEVWNKYYAKRNALNLGYSGDRTEHVLWRLDHGEVDGISPKLVTLMIGTNNTGHRMDPPADIAAGIQAIIGKLKTKLPESKILILAIFPRDAKTDGKKRMNNDAVNKLIKKFADDKKVFYLDINSAFLTDEGVLEKSVMPDLLHPKGPGYQMWAKAMEDKIVELMGDK